MDIQQLPPTLSNQGQLAGISTNSIDNSLNIGDINIIIPDNNNVDTRTVAQAVINEITILRRQGVA